MDLHSLRGPKYGRHWFATQPVCDLPPNAHILSCSRKSRLRCYSRDVASCERSWWLQVVSTCLAGAAIGSTIGAGLAEKFGRKGTLMLDVIPLLAGALISASATSLNAMIAGRSLIGIGIGLASALVPTYISEVRRPAMDEPRAGRASAPVSAPEHYR